MARILKIVIIGATGYKQHAPQRIDCFPWEKLADLHNLRDYDVVILNLLSLDPTVVDWPDFERVLNLNVTIEMLKSNATIIVLGDPRFIVPASKQDETANQLFLSWTGMSFVWDNGRGDTVELSGDYKHEKFEPYLKNLQRWDYSLQNCTLDREALKEKFNLDRLENKEFSFTVQRDTMCTNRYGNPLAFSVRFAFEEHKRTHSGTRTETMFSFGPIVFLPKLDVDDDQAIITVLRDQCGVIAQSPEPSWIADFVAPGQKTVDDRVQRTKSQIETLRQELASAQVERSKTRECLKLIYERGAALEAAVRNVLRALGAHVEDPTDPGKEDGWITVRVGDETLAGVLEVKSTRNEQFGEDGIRQLLDWVNRGIQIRQKRYKGIFIGNSAIEKPVLERPWAFADNWKKSAEVGHLVALKTEDLYIFYLLNAQGKLDRDELWKQLFATNGLFDATKYREKLTPKDDEQAKAAKS